LGFAIIDGSRLTPKHHKKAAGARWAKTAIGEREHEQRKENYRGPRADSKGKIIAVRLQGNSTITPIKQAIRMAKRGKIDEVVVKPRKGKEHYIA
jgi:hypothetical protein